MKKIRYRVTTSFGSSNDGDILDAYLICSGDNGYLVFHPYRRGECASIEICVREGGDFVSLNEESYINIPSKKEREIFEDMISSEDE